MAKRVTVRVPASSGNVGSGFDCLGLALALTVDVTLILGPQEATPRHRMTRMVTTAVRATFRAAGQPAPETLSMEWHETGEALPPARGLGISAAARAAGIVGANALLGSPLSDDELLELGADLEGHADNMAPALFGGLQVTVREKGRWRHLAVPLPEELKVVLFVPDFTMPTRESRKRLPRRLSREDAVYNLGRAAMLVSALTQGHWELLDAATQDRIHQPTRAKIFSALYDIIDAAKEGGAYAGYLSGGGSTVAALATEGEERIARLMQQAAIARGYSGRSVITAPSAVGARVVEP